MSKTLSPVNRFFLRPQFSIYYRRLHRFQWSTDGVSDYGVLFLLDGTLIYDSESGDATLEPRQSLLFAPGRSISATGKNVESLVVTFAPAYIVDYAVRAHLVGGGSAPTFSSTAIDQDKRLTQLLADLADELAHEEVGKDIVIAALTEQVAVHLLRQHSKMRRSDELELSRVGLIDRRIRRAVEFMQTHLAQELPLKEIAAASYLSPYHFARLFKRITGLTPHNYLANIRIEQARHLLGTSDLSINAIATRVGYDSQSHFAKVFRAATGLTPKEFRNAAIQRQ